MRTQNPTLLATKSTNHFSSRCYSELESKIREGQRAEHCSGNNEDRGKPPGQKAQTTQKENRGRRYNGPRLEGS